MKQQNSKNRYGRRQNLNQKHIGPLVNELEKLINPASPKCLKYSCKPTTLLVDFMPIIGRVSLKNMSKVIADFDLSWKAINNVCGHNTISIYDSYI